MRLLHKALIAPTIATLLICGGGAVYASRLKPIEPPVVAYPLNATIVFNLVNKERVNAGLKPLVRDARLDASAQAKADDMVAKNYFAHYNPANNEFVGNDYLMNPGLCSFSSENIVWVKYETPQEDNQEAVDWWMNSKPHREAILNPDYTSSGLSINDKRIVQHFCVNK